MIRRALPALLASALALPAQAPPNPAPRDKCPVCGMFVAKYPEWLASVRQSDGSWLYFDGAKDFFTYLQAPGRYRQGAQAPVAVFARDYYRLTWIDARQAWYVLGSDVLGPMGAELVPFATEAAARAFLKDHRGRRILRFAEVDAAVLKVLA